MFANEFNGAIQQKQMTCPHCGKIETIESDMQMDAYVFEGAGSILLHNHCEGCNWHWTEYYSVNYDGYVDATGEYDAEGVRDGGDEV